MEVPTIGNKVLMLDPALFQHTDHGDVVDSNNALDGDRMLMKAT